MSETSQPRTIKIGIIGVGQIGKHHIETYRKLNGVEILAIADTNAAEAERVAAQYAVPHILTDFRQLLRLEEIEAVDVALHNNLHRPVTVAALEAGKQVYCEKPMAGAYIDALAMFETAQRTGRKLSIQLNTLFAKETLAARELIAAGRLGRLYHARSTGFRRRGRPFVDGYGSATFVKKEIAAGGALYDMGVYHIACLLYLLGNPAVQTISARLYQEVAMDAARQAESGYNVEELGVGFVRLADHISMDIIEAWAVNLDRLDGSVILGSEGGIRLEPFGFFSSQGDLELSATADLDHYAWRRMQLRPEADAYTSAQAHWIAALQGRVELLPTAELALNTMLISEGCYLSEQLNREVSAEEVRQHSQSTALTV